MHDHCALRQPGCPGGIAQDRDVIWFTKRDLLLEGVRVCLLVLTPKRLDFLVAHQPIAVVIPQAALIPVDHLTDVGQLLA